MKYLNTYETYENKSNYYWKVRTVSPFFEIALYIKFNLPENKIKTWRSMRDYRCPPDEIFIAPYDKNIDYSWTYGSEEWFETNNYIYQGEIKYTADDLDNIGPLLAAKKFNI